MNDFQWVNEGFFLAYGFGATREWTAEDWRARLANRSEENAPVRQAIFAIFRNPDFREVTPDAEPQLYGDKAELPPDAIDRGHQHALRRLRPRDTRRQGEAPDRRREVKRLPVGAERAAKRQQTRLQPGIPGIGEAGREADAKEIAKRGHLAEGPEAGHVRTTSGS